MPSFFNFITAYLILYFRGQLWGLIYSIIISHIAHSTAIIVALLFTKRLSNKEFLKVILACVLYILLASFIIEVRSFLYFLREC